MSTTVDIAKEILIASIRSGAVNLFNMSERERAETIDIVFKSAKLLLSKVRKDESKNNS